MSPTLLPFAFSGGCGSLSQNLSNSCFSIIFHSLKFASLSLFVGIHSSLTHFAFPKKKHQKGVLLFCLFFLFLSLCSCVLPPPLQTIMLQSTHIRNLYPKLFPNNQMLAVLLLYRPPPPIPPYSRLCLGNMIEPTMSLFCLCVCTHTITMIRFHFRPPPYTHTNLKSFPHISNKLR